MMMPALLLRRKRILKKLKVCNAVSPDTAKTLKEAGVLYPNAFLKVTDDLVKQNKIGRVGSQKYYLK